LPVAAIFAFLVPPAWRDARLLPARSVEAEHIQMILHWQGGDHTAVKVKKNGAGKHRWTISEDTLPLVRDRQTIWRCGTCVRSRRH
jgi:hypothetical protein